MPDFEPRTHALAAASQATEANAELLRFAIEGDGIHQRFETDVVEQLADALVMALEIEGGETAEDEKGQLYSAAKRFLEGWV